VAGGSWLAVRGWSRRKPPAGSQVPLAEKAGRALGNGSVTNARPT